MSQSYSKTWLNYADQVSRLQQRGLTVSDTAKAERFLAHANYYRFSGYCLAFETSRHSFAPGTTFEQVLGAYEFDLVLRDLLTEAFEVIEVDLRANIAYYFGQKFGAFGHVDPVNFYAGFRHSDWLGRLQDEANRSSELFIQHFKNSYSEFPNLPVWIATEIMSFGGLSQMVKGMNRVDQRSMASNWGLQAPVLQSWLHHFVYMRNLCAHHSRVWDRVWGIKPTLPRGNHWVKPLLRSNRHLFATLLLLRYWLKRVPAVAKFSNDWKMRVETLLDSPPTASNPAGRMGLTINWKLHPVWR